MRKSILILLLALCLHPVPLCGAQVLLVGIDDWPPYEYMDEMDKPAGLAVDIFNSVLDRMNVIRPNYVSMPWKRGLVSLKTGAVDVLLCGIYAESRTGFVRYPKAPLVDSFWSLYSLQASKNAPPKRLEDFKGLSVGMVIGFSYPENFTLFSRKHMQEHWASSDTINLRKLSKGRLDLVVGEVRNLDYLIRQMGLQQTIGPAGPVLKRDNLYAFFSKSKVTADFVNRFSDALIRFRKTSAYQALVKRHTQQALQVDKPVAH